MVKTPVLTAFLCASAVASLAQSPPAPGKETTQTPAPAKETAPAAKPAIKSLGGSRYELNGITFDEKTRAISLPALVNMTEGLLEYAIVEAAGKVHESLLSTAISPFDLNIVLLLLNYQPSPTFFDLSDMKAGAVLVKNPKPAPAADLKITLEWQDESGKTQAAPLESLLLNIDEKGTVSPGAFTYTGSFLMEDGTFMAKDTGSILALYADAAALINNPRPGNDLDDIWIPDQTKVPAKGTAITVTLAPAKPPAKPLPKPPTKSRTKPASK